MRAPDRAFSVLPPACLLLILPLVLGLTSVARAPAADAALRTSVEPATAPALSARQDPRMTRPFFVARESQAFRAGVADPRLAEIGDTPQAQWMSDTWMPVRTVKRQARSYVRAAERAGRTPLLAVYAIPDRDCGGYSSGGLSPRDYRRWVSRMAAGIRGSHAIAILEPDALGLLDQCGGATRVKLLRYAARTLTRAGAWVYLDAGHVGWTKPAVMARRLERAGIAHARGFATNVASTVRTKVTNRYAHRIARVLARRGHPGSHYLVDTSRNGSGTADGNDWCNPMDVRIGRKPVMVGRGRLDGYVWVKSPGESDGTCRGGPPAGQFWPWYALHLLGRA